MTAKKTVLPIGGDRLWSDLQELGRIGWTEREPGRERGQGVSRLAFTPEDMEGRRWLLGKMREAGLKAWMDGVGNVFGRYEPNCSDATYPAIMLGSHIDTVPEGGRFDGALGVLGALECVRTIIESGIALRHPVEVAAFANEEGSRVGHGTFGSRSFVYGLAEDEASSLVGTLIQAGISGEPRRLKDGELACYLELHIEQGGVLDAAGDDIGVVTGIVGIRSFIARFHGLANHAGTTPMNMRKDALVAAARLILDVPELVAALGSGSSVGTCGRISVVPGGQNVIPGEAEVSVEVRDLNNNVSERLISALRERADAIAQERGLRVTMSPPSAILAVPLDGQVQGDIEAAAAQLGLRARRMPSGAAHDCMHLARVVPSGMIFVPSSNGISHSPDEWTEKGRCSAGAEVLLHTVLQLDARLDV